MAESQHHKKLLSHLESVSVGDLLPQRAIVMASGSDTVAHVLEKMSEENILSVPVFDGKKGQITGMFDLHDVLKLALEVVDGKQDSDAFMKKTAREVSNLSQVDVFMPVEETLSIFHLLEWFTRGIHRVPVTNVEGTVVNIVSQSSVIRFIHEHLEDEKLRASTLTSLKIGKKSVLRVPKEESAAEVLRMMSNEFVDAVPVVDAGSGKFVGTFSVSCLRGIRGGNLVASLSKPVGEFTHGKFARPVHAQCCREDATLGAVLSSLAEHGGHRIWIVDEKEHPVGVVTLTNLIMFFMKYFSGHHAK